MNTEFTVNGWTDFEYWLEHDPDMVQKITELVRSIKQNPFKEFGKAGTSKA